MPDKERLTDEATKKGFKSKFFHPDPLKYSDNEPDRWYLYMCEIHQWLREKHNILITIIPIWDHFAGKIDQYYAELRAIDMDEILYDGARCNEYNEALEDGIHEALEFIKKEE